MTMIIKRWLGLPSKDDPSLIEYPEMPRSASILGMQLVPIESTSGRQGNAVGVYTSFDDELPGKVRHGRTLKLVGRGQEVPCGDHHVVGHVAVNGEVYIAYDVTWLRKEGLL